MMQEVYRDHCCRFVWATVTVLILTPVVTWVLSWIMGSIHHDFQDGSYIPVTIFLIALLVVSRFITWRSTRYTFTDSELVITNDTFWTPKDRRAKEFQYASLAKIVVEHDLSARPFGAAAVRFYLRSTEEHIVPDATLVLRTEQAEDLGRRLNGQIFGIEPVMPADDDAIPSLVEVSNAGIAVHCICTASWPVWLLAVLALCAFGWELYNGSVWLAVGCAAAFLIFTSPIRRAIRRYRDFRVYREGDIIKVHGRALGDVSVRVGMVCSVEYRKVFTGRYVLDADVISKDGKRRLLLLCPMKGKDEVMELFGRLLPEFCPAGEAVGGRAEPMWARILRAVPAAAVWLGAFLCAYDWYKGTAGASDLVASAALSVGAAGALIMMAFAARTHSGASIILSDDLFICRGRSSGTYVNYDRMQSLDVRSKPFQRRYGVGYLSVVVPAAYGHKAKHFGTFDLELLSKVPNIVLATIREGRCDPGTRP